MVLLNTSRYLLAGEAPWESNIYVVYDAWLVKTFDNERVVLSGFNLFIH